MNAITRDLISPDDTTWESINRKLGCHDCKYARRDKLIYAACCSHHADVLVDLQFRCLHRKKR